MRRAIARSVETGRKWYVRGYQRTISNPGQWLYGCYDRPDPALDRRNRPHQWWADDTTPEEATR